MGLRVLIADDSPGMRKMIRRVMSFANVEIESCLEAGDGVEALALLRENAVDVLLTDINMPKLDGEQLLEAAAKLDRFASVHVIVVSTDQSDARITRMLARGAHGYVTKPFTPETLDAALARISETVVQR